MSQHTKDTSAPNHSAEQTEQHFNILPHPAKSNHPADLAGSPPLAASLTNPGIQAYHARGPYVPSKDIIDNLEAPLSREELGRRAQELNMK